MQLLLDVHILANGSRQDVSMSSCPFTACLSSPPSTSTLSQKNPRICANLGGRSIGGWASGPPDLPGQRRPCSMLLMPAQAFPELHIQFQGDVMNGREIR